MVYIGPQQLDAWTTYDEVSDFIIHPAFYDLKSTTGQTF